MRCFGDDIGCAIVANFVGRCHTALKMDDFDQVASLKGFYALLQLCLEETMNLKDTHLTILTDLEFIIQILQIRVPNFFCIFVIFYF